MNKRLQDTLKQLESKQIRHNAVDMGAPTRRAKDVENSALDIDSDIIVKTIMFKSKKHGNFAVSVKSEDRIAYKKLKTIFDDKNISTLRPERMQELGWEPGECCPLTIPGPLLVDPTVFELDWIHSGSGDLHFGLEYDPQIIKTLRDDVRVKDVRDTT